MPTGLVFNVQKYSVQDGPGIRTTVFLKGCPLSCAWCHNPEGQSSESEFIVVETRCVACGECRRACPFEKSPAGEAALPARNSSCVACEACVAACPTGARQRVGREMTVAEVRDVVLQDHIFYEESGGGVTFSGGEPLMQPEFLLAVLETCRARGLHTAVDTCGFASPETLLAVAALTDLFLYDLKFMDAARHRQFCGVANGLILENLRALAAAHANLWIRVPVIPGVNDNADNLSAMARFVALLKGVRQVNVLPYHPTGAQKFRRLGQEYSLAAARPPAPEVMENAANIFRACGLTAKVGG